MAARGLPRPSSPSRGRVGSVWFRLRGRRDSVLSSDNFSRVAFALRRTFSQLVAAKALEGYPSQVGRDAWFGARLKPS